MSIFLGDLFLKYNMGRGVSGIIITQILSEEKIPTKFPPKSTFPSAIMSKF